MVSEGAWGIYVKPDRESVQGGAQPLQLEHDLELDPYPTGTVEPGFPDLWCAALSHCLERFAGCRGSYVQVPSVGHISKVLHSSINLLTAAHHVTVEELLEARELLEVPAARLAAERRANDDVTRLRQCIHDSGPTVDAAVELAHNTDFHAIVLATSGNTLLAIAAQPVFNVLMSGFSHSSLGTRFHQSVSGMASRASSRNESDASTTDSLKRTRGRSL